MSSIEELRERWNEIQSEARDDNQKRRHSIDLIRDIEIAKKDLSAEDALPFHELMTEIGKVVFGVDEIVEATPKSPDQRRDAARAERDRRETNEQALAQAEREHQARLAASEARKAEFEATSSKYAAERAHDILERDKTLLRRTVATGMLTVLGVLAVLFTLWFFFHGPSASEQLEDKFRQDCIAKGWDYRIDSNNDSGIGTVHGNCEAP